MHFTSSITAILAVSPVAMAATQTVQVGQNNGLTFSPNTVTMNVGDQLVFQFDNAVRPNGTIPYSFSH
jgi:plastocyanin